MLVIARRKGQRIVIGEGIEIVITDVSRGNVKLGIIAPPRCLVARGEIRDAILAANREAAATSIDAKALSPGES